MQKIYSCSHAAELEKSVKQQYAVPDFLMMENAAKAMVQCFLPDASVLIICGKGNNGGDGYALARLLQNKFDVKIVSLEEPSSAEAKVQCEMCRRFGIKKKKKNKLEELCNSLTANDYIVD